MLMRSALGALSATALVAATAAPAVADGDRHHDDDKLRVVVCVLVDNDDDDEEFDIKVWTDEDSDDATLGHRECARFKLAFDDNLFHLEEDVDTDDWDVTFKVFGDDERSWSDDGRLTVKFDDDEDDPRLGIIVKNEAVDDDNGHHRWRDHDHHDNWWRKHHHDHDHGSWRKHHHDHDHDWWRKHHDDDHDHDSWRKHHHDDHDHDSWRKHHHDDD